MTIAIAYGVDICIEVNITINCKKKRKGLESSQTHLTLQHHPSVDPRMVCASSAPSSITVHHQPFNKITYQYSLSSNNFTALYQLNIF